MAFPTYPYGFPARRDRPVHERAPAAACSATSPRRARRSSRSSARSTRRRASGSSTRPPTRSSRSPRTRRRSRSRSSTTACRAAREILTGKHAVGRVIARPFIGEPGSYERTPNRHDFSLEPRAPELPDRDPRRRATRSTASARSATSSPAATSTSRSRPSRTSTGIQTDRSSCSRTSTTGFVFTNLVETDMLWGHRNDPVNFHRCLQDFDRRLPDILEALRAGDLLDHHLGPRLRPDDAVDRPLARARAAARVRRGAERRRADPRTASSPTSARP